MRTVLRRALGAAFKTRTRRLLWLAGLLCAIPLIARFVVLVLWTVPVFGGRLAAILNPNAAHGLAYFHDSVREVPWSMHVLKISRARKDLELHAAMGRGAGLAMATVPEQIRALPPEWGRPVAAVNGDLYNDHPDYPGDPEGLLIVHGELVSGPSPTRVCFWLDADGNPHRDDVRSRFEVTWPDGTTTPFGLNEARPDDGTVLYTAVVGGTTRTKGGLDVVLDRDGEGPWLPLQVGRMYRARIRETHATGNAPVAPGTMVLSLGPGSPGLLSKAVAGAVVQLSTATSPALVGVHTAIGGGPTLVTEGRAKEWAGITLRHPRTALGWNAEHFFLVVIDGRQLRLSAGMTFPELADYLVKLGCQEAIALDGGGSATCWAYGNVMNSPSQGRERPAANALVVMQTGQRRK
jgi:hypothetical protein